MGECAEKKARLVQDLAIIQNEAIASGQHRLRFNAPEMARIARPGQFCMVRTAPGYVPFLRRPMCFEQIYEDGFSILFKVEGEGTALLAAMLPGQTLNIQGPLGYGWPLDAGNARHILVAGGIGVAPFPCLAKALIANGFGAPEVILAARAKSLLLCEQTFLDMGCAVHIVTDDGSAGVKAFACDMLARLAPGPGDCVYVCGPMIMMSTTARIAMTAGAKCLVSLEAQMACGDGACLGCVVEAKVEVDGERKVRVCLEGPVFDAEKIAWEAHDFAYDR